MLSCEFACLIVHILATRAPVTKIPPWYIHRDDKEKKKELWRKYVILHNFKLFYFLIYLIILAGINSVFNKKCYISSITFYENLHMYLMMTLICWNMSWIYTKLWSAWWFVLSIVEVKSAWSHASTFYTSWRDAYLNTRIFHISGCSSTWSNAWNMLQVWWIQASTWNWNKSSAVRWIADGLQSGSLFRRHAAAKPRSKVTLTSVESQEASRLRILWRQGSARPS